MYYTYIYIPRREALQEIKGRDLRKGANRAG
jgi:hypothetical protein